MSQDISKTRRAALKTGSAALFGSGLVTRVGAAKPSNEYVGIVYDPQTKDYRGTASGRITERHQNLVGKVDLNGQSFSINQRATNVAHNEHANATLSDFAFQKRGEHERNNKPLQVYATAVDGGNISGITDYGVNAPKRGFILQRKESGQSESDIVDELTSSLERWK
ncbi:hypothetical protein [Halorussus ruber]|uniref:hypothetical protein n=1 Tax=Halorussus ruber TaxID=1126238 RepID=UPI001092304E|nr:hypothetical protein [Halorussus ruber]